MEKLTLKKIYKQLVEDVLLHISVLLNKVDTVNNLFEQNRYAKYYQWLVERLRELGSTQLSLTTKSVEEAFKRSSGFECPQDMIDPVWCEDGLRFSDRIWKDKGKLVEQLNKALIDGIQAGNDLTKHSQEIAKVCGTSYSNAERLIRTEAQRAYIQGTLEKYKKEGVEKIQLIEADDERTCEECKKRNGEILPIDTPVGDIIKHPRCRVSIKAVL